MTHYSDHPNACRVDFFKPSGKWRETLSVFWPDEYATGDWTLRRAFAEVLRRHFEGLGQHSRLSEDDGFAVCLEPHHAHSHPIMLRISELAKMPKGRPED